MTVRFERRGRTQSASDHDTDRDRGSALPLVLVLIVVASMIIVPTLTYAVSVLKANTVLSAKTQRIEAVKGGLRLALAEPQELYQACANSGPTVAVRLADSELNDKTVTTNCYMIDVASSQSAEEIRFGVATTRVGTPPPAGLAGNTYVPADPASTTEWQTVATTASETDKIWLPNLPVHALSPRAPGGSAMAAGFPTCRVYFPGTYVDPITLNGPTFFTSGIYYFERDVTLTAGASVVVGDGATPGCTTSQEAVFYAQNVPSTHNISGLGATWVLGDSARVVVDNATGDVSLKFNARYAASGDTGDAPSQGVSIATVNGELAPDGVTGVGLDIPGTINVPLSVVGSVDPVSAIGQEYKPSIVTPRPRPPASPTNVVAQPYASAARVSWTAPADNGSPITGYTVTASGGGQTCTTRGATVCVVSGLTNGSSRNFTVVATTAAGTSLPSTPSPNVTIGGSTLVVPSTPAAPTAIAYGGGVAQVRWTAVAPSLSPISSYTVTASPGGATCVVDMTTSFVPEMACDIAGLSPLVLPGYQFTVTASNSVGPSVASPPSANLLAVGLGTPPAIAVAPSPPPYVPPAVIDLRFAGTGAATIDIPGYVSVPQGRVSLDNPRNLDVRISGGVLASQIDVVDGRPAPIPVGLVESVVQRKLRIVSRIAGSPEVSTAIVQVNQNGAYAINSWEVQATSDEPVGGPVTTAPPEETTTTTVPEETTTTTVPEVTTTTTVPEVTTTTTIPTPTTTLPPVIPPVPSDGTSRCNDVTSNPQGWSQDFGPGTWAAEYWNWGGSRPSFDSNNPFSGSPTQTTTMANIAACSTSSPYTGVQEDDFSARFTKTWTTTDARDVTFLAGGDDGYRVFVNGTRIVNNWDDHAHEWSTQTVTLPAGTHTIVFEYYENAGNNTWQLWRN